MSRQGAFCTVTLPCPVRYTRSWEETNLTDPRSSVAGAGGISPTGSPFVKPNAAVLSDLPVVAFSASLRGFGITCLSPKLTTIRAMLGTPRRSTSDSDKKRTIFDALTGVFNDTAAQTIVLEADSRTLSRPVSILNDINDWADDRGIRVVHFTLAYACTEVCGESQLTAAALHIAFRYPALLERLLNAREVLVRDAERWRHLRPLVVAFVLAHAFAARSVINAFGGLIPPHPKSNYDSGKP
jgi:hypothetical protein